MHVGLIDLNTCFRQILIDFIYRILRYFLNIFKDFSKIYLVNYSSILGYPAQCHKADSFIVGSQLYLFIICETGLECVDLLRQFQNVSSALNVITSMLWGKYIYVAKTILPFCKGYTAILWRLYCHVVYRLYVFFTR